MAVNDRIEILLQKLICKGINTETTGLYAEGIKAKLQATHFALENLRELEHLEERSQVQDDTTTLIKQSLLPVDDKINFYCECVWVFLRSSLDILAQLVNELYPLNLNERQVDFKQVAKNLEHSGTLLEEAVNNCQSSDEFKNLEEYRHCSMHRRRVLIETKEETRTHTTRITWTRDYNYDGTIETIKETTTVERYLCENPSDLQPKVNYKRPVVGYCEHLLQAIEKHVNTIINQLP